MGGSPYPDLSLQQVIYFVTAGNRMRKTKEIPSSIYEVMFQCWKEIPDERPTFVQLQDKCKEILNMPENVS